MSKKMKMTIKANDITEAINFLRIYFPIKKNDIWEKAEITAYANKFNNLDDAFVFLEDNCTDNTIHICGVNNDSFAYVYTLK
jgi:hypothetical protein